MRHQVAWSRTDDQTEGEGSGEAWYHSWRSRRGHGRGSFGRLFEQQVQSGRIGFEFERAGRSAGPQLTIDGQNQNVNGQVTCNVAGDNTNIGIGDATNGVGAVVSNANPPIVHSVGLGNVNGVALGFSDAAPGAGGNAGAAQNGKTYAINGTATGVDMSNPQQPQQVKKSFQMNVTCP